MEFNGCCIVVGALCSSASNLFRKPFKSSKHLHIKKLYKCLPRQQIKSMTSLLPPNVKREIHMFINHDDHVIHDMPPVDPNDKVYWQCQPTRCMVRFKSSQPERIASDLLLQFPNKEQSGFRFNQAGTCCTILVLHHSLVKINVVCQKQLDLCWMTAEKYNLTSDGIHKALDEEEPFRRVWVPLSMPKRRWWQWSTRSRFSTTDVEKLLLSKIVRCGLCLLEIRSSTQ